MAALTAASWTTTITERKHVGKEKMVRGTLALAGTDTYPTHGIPLPAISNFGFVRQINDLRIVGQATATTQYLYMYDKTNHKLQVYEEEAAAAGGPLLEADTMEVPGPRTLFFEALGW